MSSTVANDEIESTAKTENKPKHNIINRALLKVLGWFGITSGIGFIWIGLLWFFSSFIEYLFTRENDVMQQTLSAMYFAESQMSLLVIAFGVLIMEVKKFRSK
ncbi:hypothetical protein [Thalassomonas sp. RHCl1]|uniref:hypothetical protein n=1 Tax=Thalassomonas sp. RHCl1 TaxID=2995320 RepID=UPI00248CCDE4|nr:hypothetical protein [Thalassomonas sp. RHCl1]